MSTPIILRLPQVKQRTGLSRTTIYRSVKAGKFPPPMLLGPRCIGWLESDLNNWIAECIAARQQQVS
jgi:prophage regulatory protein